MSYQRWTSCCTLPAGKHNSNNTSINKKKARSKNSTRSDNINANILIIGNRYASLFHCRKYIDVLPWFSYVGNAYEWCLWVVLMSDAYEWCLWVMLMSDQRWRSSCTWSDGKHNNNNTSNKKTRSKNSTGNANIHLVTKCQGVPGTTKRLPMDGEHLG